MTAAAAERTIAGMNIAVMTAASACVAPLCSSIHRPAVARAVPSVRNNPTSRSNPTISVWRRSPSVSDMLPLMADSAGSSTADQRPEMKSNAPPRTSRSAPPRVVTRSMIAGPFDCHQLPSRPNHSVAVATAPITLPESISANGPTRSPKLSMPAVMSVNQPLAASKVGPSSVAPNRPSAAPMFANAPPNDSPAASAAPPRLFSRTS